MATSLQPAWVRRLGIPDLLLGRFVQFCTVGTSGLVVDNAVLFLLVDGLGGPLLIGKLLAAETAMVNNFIWNDRWTFRDLGEARREGGARLKRFLRFNAFCAAGLALQILGLQFLAVTVGWNLYLANIAAIGLATGWNFGMNYWFNWRSA